MSKIALEVRGVSSKYGKIAALKDINLVVNEGQLVSLVGSNGAGKTTLLRCISGAVPLSAGDIYFEGKPISTMPAHRRVELGICQVPEGRQVFPSMTIEDNLLMGAYVHRKKDFKPDLQRMYDLFPILWEKKSLLAGALSGGQQQMLAMARAIMGRPRVLLLDEPSMGLAPLIVEEIFRVVRSLKAQGVTIFLVEQNAHAALQIADFGYVLETGSIVLSGTGDDLLSNESVKQAYLGM